jgi:Ribonuclease G/E
MRRQGIGFIDIAKALDKTERAVSQKYLKLCPLTNSTKKKNADVQMTELQKVRLLAVVSRRKGGWWNEVATEIEGGFTGAQCEVMWNQITRG